jgi:hypothetical protein
MAKTVEAVINGTAYQMPASYKASKEIAEKVGDPLKLAMAAHHDKTATMSVDDIVQIIAIGCKHAGCGLPVDAIGEAVVDAGVMNYLPVVGNYLLAICTGASGGAGPAKKASRK